jgi:hypothetical protein
MLHLRLKKNQSPVYILFVFTQHKAKPNMNIITNKAAIKPENVPPSLGISMFRCYRKSRAIKS